MFSSSTLIFRFSVLSSRMAASFRSLSPLSAARQRDAAVTCHTLAFRLLAVFRVPASTTMPRRTSSIRLGRAVDGFIANPAAISSSVAGP
jgi:hypothetical protein